MMSHSQLGEVTLTQNNFVFNFVKKDEGMSEIMQHAYDDTITKFTANILTNDECLHIPKAKLKEEQYIFVFDDFDTKNEAFAYVYNANTVYILGSRCVLTMLLEAIQVPAGVYHVHNLAMRSMVISTTGMKKSRKKEIEMLVTRCGANYQDDLTVSVTHLVSETVRSDKYVHAAMKGLKIMHPDWVNDVYQKTQNTHNNINAAEERFDRYKLPFFFGLCIASTGLKVTERNEIKTLVEENGGRYSGSFNKAVDLLIIEESSIGSLKFKEAMKMNKICLSLQWIYDSVEKGFAVAIEKYTINPKVKSSTPTKGNVSRFNTDNTNLNDLSRISSFAKPPRVKASTPTKVDVSVFNPDSTQLSEISRVPTDVSLNETALSSCPSFVIEYKKTLEKIKLTEAKKAGNLLDGFNVFLSGFMPTEILHLGKILSVLGATKIDELNDQITHVLIGASDPKIFAEINDLNLEPTVLRVEWLAQLVMSKEVPEEGEFEIERLSKKKSLLEKPSPASKRAISSLSGTFKKPAIPKFSLNTEMEAEIEDQMALINQYSERATETSESIAKIFLGKYIFIYGYSDPLKAGAAVEHFEQLGATLVDNTFHREVDYVVTSTESLNELKPGVKYKNIVSEQWLVDSVEANECVEIKFYHKPLTKVEKHLKDEVIVVSNYKGKERQFIELLCRELGGIYSEVLKRNDNAIIISPNAEGRKFDSAKSWGLSVLPVDWLLKCMEMNCRVDESSFLIGGTNPSKNNKKRRESIIPSSQDIQNLSGFDVVDPPIENFGDDDDDREESLADKYETPPMKRPIRFNSNEQTPMSPSTPNLSPSRLVVDMSEPRRTLTLAALRENQSKHAISPRKLRLKNLIETPATKARRIAEDSPALIRPELPDCMKYPEVNYALRPNASPETQHFHKRKLEALDTLYLSRSGQKKQRVEPVEPTPPGHRRYDFFKARLASFNSPDPRATNPIKPSLEAAKALEYEDEENENEEQPIAKSQTDDTLKGFRRLEVKTSDEILKKKQILLDSERCATTSGKHCSTAESENLVTWNDPNATRSPSNNLDDDGEVYVGETAPEQYFFAFNMIAIEEKERMHKIVDRLGGIIHNQNFTHLIVGKLNRSEKFLTAVASGRFALHPAYIDRCEEEGRFVEEAEYEYGNPEFRSELINEMDVNEDIFFAPHKWRKWISARPDLFPKGAFSNLKFTVAAPSEKVPQIVTSVEAGGGKYVSFENMKTTRLKPEVLKAEQLDYCIAQDGYISLDNKELLRKFNVKITSLLLLSDYLFKTKVMPSKAAF